MIPGLIMYTVTKIVDFKEYLSAFLSEYKSRLSVVNIRNH